MKKLALAALSLAISAPALAQKQYSQEEIVLRIADCMKETAPKDWTEIVFTLDQELPDPEDPGKTVASHKAAGKTDKALKEIKPCRRPDWVSKAVQAFRETQDDKARGWTGITVTMQRDGHYSINYRYPK